MLIVSTLLSPIRSITITGVDWIVVPIPTLILEVIPTSAKFLSPEGWTNLLTGSTKSSQVTGLLIEYDRFW